jgi:hypothetical protein
VLGWDGGGGGSGVHTLQSQPVAACCCLLCAGLGEGGSWCTHTSVLQPVGLDAAYCAGLVGGGGVVVQSQPAAAYWGGGGGDTHTTVAAGLGWTRCCLFSCGDSGVYMHFSPSTWM